MHLHHPRKDRVEVVAAVIFNGSGQFLLAQRPVGKVYAGYWEFPGGKVDAGESTRAALARELHEELGIEVITAYPWLTRDFDYEHAAVRLRFFRVMAWSGTLQSREAQEFSWQSIDSLSVAPLLPANGPILRALAVPHIYAITCAQEMGRAAQLAAIEHALRDGLRLIQVREKRYTPEDLAAFATEVVALAHPFGARVLVNGAAGIANQAGADGVHMTAAQLTAAARRPGVNWCAASCHDAAELKRAGELQVDFAVLGPVNPTPSHPATAVLGWRHCAALVESSAIPVFALGGMRPADLTRAWACGAHGIAMMRGAWFSE